MARAKCRNFGSAALHLAYTAKGSLTGTVFAAGVKLWDIAAGGLIAQAAGVKVTDWNDQPLFPLAPDDYDGDRIHAIAANPKAHTEILEILNS